MPGVSFFIFLCFYMIIFPTWAKDCVQYKKLPAVFINTPDWKKTVVQPKNPMDLWHGNVVATLVDNYNITADINKVDDGFCIGIKSVDAVVGYNDFLVQIDIRHVPDSCQYDAVLAHEDKHINAYLSVIDDFKPDLQKALFEAADSVMPIFVKDKQDIDIVINAMNDKLQSHPDLVIVKQKIKAAEEIRNKKIDANENNMDLKNCL